MSAQRSRFGGGFGFLLSLLALESSRALLLYGSEALKNEYLRRGNIHRDWHMDRIIRNRRRGWTINADGAAVESEHVTSAYAMPKDQSILATSVGVSHIELPSALKTMIVLREDSEALRCHQKQYEDRLWSRIDMRPLAAC